MKNSKKPFVYLSLLMGLLIVLSTNCKKEEKYNMPSLTTAKVEAITPTTAICGGIITDDGGTLLTSKGVVWNISQDPTLESHTGKTHDGTGTDSFTSTLTGLTPGTIYYVRAYATNSEGTSYGETHTFSTLSGTILLTTMQPVNIRLTSATCGGDITDDGGAPLTSRGVVWDTSQEPTLERNAGKTTDGTGIGSFTSSLTGLTGYSTYYVRAYASNSVGTCYGNQVSFKTSMPDGPGDPVTDADGNSYSTVWINGLLWMAENLKTTKYNDGTDIPLVTDKTEWLKTTPAYCWYNNDLANKNPYGALYNGYAVQTRKLCPTGWHVPSLAETQGLTDYLGGEGVAGGKLKEAGTEHWYTPNTGGINLKDFTALPGGCRDYGNGNFLNLTRYGYIWCSTDYVSNVSAYHLRLIYNTAASSYGGYSLKAGISVRCVADY